MTIEVIVGEVRVNGYRRVAFSLYRSCRPDETPEERFRLDLQAWLHVLPRDTAFTHLTACLLLGVRLPPLPQAVPVFAATRSQVTTRRSGLIISRLRHPAEPHAHGDLPVDDLREVFLRASRDLGTLDVVVMLDSALRKGLVTKALLREFCESHRRPGVARLRAAVTLADGRAESGPETVSRVMHEVFEIPVTPQAPLLDSSGRQFGRADLLVNGTRFVHEYDGAGHRAAAQHAADLRRDRRLIENDYIRRGFTLPDLIQHAGATMSELDTALGRPRRLARLRRWRRMLEESLFTDAGKQKLISRWARIIDVPDWARNAS